MISNEYLDAMEKDAKGNDAVFTSEEVLLLIERLRHAEEKALILGSELATLNERIEKNIAKVIASNAILRDKGK